jgi:TetR/AcrR family transcriptional repressor of bet genes
MGRKSNTGLRRRQIMEALLQEMSCVGYERASTKSIAARAGLAAGLVHYHFQSKEEILLELVDGLIAEADRRCEASLAADTPPRRKLEAYATSRLGLGAGADDVQVKAWVVLLAEGMGQAKVRNRVSKWLARDQDRLVALFRAAGAKTPKDHAAALLAMILGSFVLHSVRPDGVPRGYAEGQAHRLIRSVVRTR